jgi:hypothetical protein
MDDIDELALPAKLEKLLRMVVMGRTDAAIKLAEVLTALLTPVETAKPKKAK